MPDLSPIVHIVVGTCSDTGKPTVFGTFFTDVAAQRLKADWYGLAKDLAVESWLIGDDDQLAEALVKQDRYPDGCKVYFDDGDVRGFGQVLWNDGHKSKPGDTLYKILGDDDSRHYMTGDEIKGLIASQGIKNNLPL